MTKSIYIRLYIDLIHQLKNKPRGSFGVFLYFICSIIRSVNMLGGFYEVGVDYGYDVLC